MARHWSEVFVLQLRQAVQVGISRGGSPPQLSRALQETHMQETIPGVIGAAALVLAVVLPLVWGQR